MKIKRFNAFSICLCAVILVLIFNFLLVTHLLTSPKHDTQQALSSLHHNVEDDSFLSIGEILSEEARDNSVVNEDTGFPHSNGYTVDHQCTFESCFNISRCRNGFKVYVYPDNHPVSEIYAKILNSLHRSAYLTTNPKEACVFVPSVDTLDRDPLSTNSVPNAHKLLSSLPYWNGGQNHLLFNMYAGTWEFYHEHEFKMPVGKAILVKASSSTTRSRSGFDIPIPLIHKQHAEVPGVKSSKIPVSQGRGLHRAHRHYLLAFKGKRYLQGIGSESRNSLHHLHNGKDVVLLTTCRHGRNWQQFADTRCKQDNLEYDRYDYDSLLLNSTFCLVPRGRRLGSYRFLETLEAGCIPVMLSNDWELPFSEVIDWSSAVLWADERLLFQVPDQLRQISETKILALRQRGQLLWNQYFSSVHGIINLVLEVLKDRVESWSARPTRLWNDAPGVQPSPQTGSCLLPWRPQTCPAVAEFSVLFSVRPPCSLAKVLMQLQQLARTRTHLHTVVMLWYCPVQIPSPPSLSIHLPSHVHLILLPQRNSSPNDKFSHWKVLPTEAVLMLSTELSLTYDHIDFAFSVWRQFPSQLVGYLRRSHHWDEFEDKWIYSAVSSASYSVVLTPGSFLHRHFHRLYWSALAPRVRDIVDIFGGCEDVLLNFLVSSVVRQPPITLLHPSALSYHTDPKQINQHQNCIQGFVQAMGYMPLRRSQLRCDPVLYRDPVASWRKFFSKLES